MSQSELISIFEDTRIQCENEISLALECRKCTEGQKLYYDEDDVFISPSNRNRFQKEALVLVSPKRTFEAASYYKKGNVNIAVLNFASATTPGGRVLSGSSAQEECLCRCSNLYASLSSKEADDLFYSVHRAELDELNNDDIIFTPQTVVFKSDTERPENLPLKDRFFCDVISCAAPDIRSFREKGKTIGDEELKAIFLKRMNRILDVAAANGDDVLILGAFGCGAFGNDPSLVAGCWKSALSGRLHDFKVIEFAVYCKDDRTNLEAFEHAFGQENFF